MRSDLYAVASDGSHLRVLARNARYAAVSPAGGRLAFERDDAIWVSRLDGSGQRQLTRRDSARTKNPPVRDGTPTWSPDGKTVYFERYVEKTESSSLFSVGLNGVPPRPLTKSIGTTVAFPTCSPNGRVIVYAESSDPYHGNDTTLSAVTASGRSTPVPFRLFHGATTSVTEDMPAWSPDGQQLAFVVQDLDAFANGESGASGLYISSVLGARPYRLSAAGYGPAWALDGKWIAFADRRGISFSRADGSGLRRVPHTTPNDSKPAWLPPR